MSIHGLFDSATNTMTYVVSDPQTKDAVIIDPVLDFDPASGRIAHKSMQTLLAYVHAQQLRVHYILETHAHADHLSSAHDLVEKHFKAAKIGIGERITTVQRRFKEILNLPESFKTDGSQFGRLFKDNEVVTAGSLSFRVLFTPGHTPACVCYYFEAQKAAFTGDVLFMPDYGTGRCDFPDGDAHALYRSVSQRLYTLAPETKLFVGHDYQPGGRALAYETTVVESREKNIQLRAAMSEDEYVTFRTTRDGTLSAPKLLFPSIQINIAAGELPPAESNGQRYLKIPLSF